MPCEIRGKYLKSNQSLETITLDPGEKFPLNILEDGDNMFYVVYCDQYDRYVLIRKIFTTDNEIVGENFWKHFDDTSVKNSRVLEQYIKKESFLPFVIDTEHNEEPIEVSIWHT